jgi:ribosomal protein S1
MISPENGTGHSGAALWAAVKVALPLGAPVTATVERVVPFGFFVKITGHPGVRAVIDRISYHPGGAEPGPDQWPVEGDPVEAVVSQHKDDDRQLKLRVGPREPSGR